MINDGAHTANDPGETRFYQTEKEGRERQRGRQIQRERERERERCAWDEVFLNLRVGNEPHCKSVFEQGTESRQIQGADSVSTA